jgi:hypothetical protein
LLKVGSWSLVEAKLVELGTSVDKIQKAVGVLSTDVIFGTSATDIL